MAGPSRRDIANPITAPPGSRSKVRLFRVQKKPAVIPVANGIIAGGRDEQSRPSRPFHVSRMLIGSTVAYRFAQPSRPSRKMRPEDRFPQSPRQARFAARRRVELSLLVEQHWHSDPNAWLIKCLI